MLCFIDPETIGGKMSLFENRLLELGPAGLAELWLATDGYP
jgi:hypothetical protein